MKEEMTNEMLEVMKKCSFSCALCDASGVCDKYDWQDTIQTLATALLEERAKPKVDVWKDAPEWASSGWFVWINDKHTRGKSSITYTRELPKTRIDKIVEEVIDGRLFGLRMEKSELTEMLKSALEKYAAELGTTT